MLAQDGSVMGLPDDVLTPERKRNIFYIPRNKPT